MLENAIKHNAITSETPLEIEMEMSNQNTLIVKNNKRPLHKKPPSFAMGLELLKKRYSFFTKQKPQIIDEEWFTVYIPVLTTRLDLESTKSTKVPKLGSAFTYGVF